MEETTKPTASNSRIHWPGELGRLLSARGLTLALAESCTGGLIGSLITDVAGSSDYFLGSAVTVREQRQGRTSWACGPRRCGRTAR